jgi:hypothetical protein
VRPTRIGHAPPTAAWPQYQIGQNDTAHGQRGQRSVLRPGRRRACGSAWSVPTHRPLNGDSALHEESPHDRVSPGSAWSNMVCVDYPSRCPHGSQRACRGSSGVMTTCRARSVARSEAVGNWMVGGKVSMGVIHGPRCTCLT